MGTSRYSCVAAAFAAFVLGAMPLAAKADTVIFQDGFEFGFQVLTPEITIAPGQQTVYCYFFHAPNASALGIRRWTSTIGAGMHHVILYASYTGGWIPSDVEPPGTLTASPCSSSGGAGDLAGWIYAAHDHVQELVVPDDDGMGIPLAATILAGQPLFLEMYVLNTTGFPVTTSALLKAEALAPQTPFTNTATYLTRKTNMSLGMGVVSVQDTCATPAGAKFWWLSTRTHHFAQMSKITNALADVVVSADWEHPAAATFAAPNFLQFGPGGLTYECTYDNNSGHPLHDGDNESSDENCIGIGYFFPAAHPALCVNNLGPL
ncbi:MAG: hypothetical protein ABIS07_15585 [Dokdonella sp.]